MAETAVRTRRFTRLEGKHRVEHGLRRPDDGFELIRGRLVVKEPAPASWRFSIVSLAERVLAVDREPARTRTRGALLR